MAGFPNKNALGNKGGAPRTYDRKQIAEDLIEWSYQPDALKYTMFARYLKEKRNILFNLTRLCDWADEDTEFAESLSIAKQNIDINRYFLRYYKLTNSYHFRKNDQFIYN